MQRFRNTEVVEAFQYTNNHKGHTISVPKWWLRTLLEGIIVREKNQQLYVNDQLVNEGDYIFKNGEKNICTLPKTQFEKYYELLPEVLERRHE